MAAQTKGRESWSLEESPETSARQSSPLKLSRVFRFAGQETGAQQISDFQDSNPKVDTLLEVRMKNFTEIENFTFLGYTLAHELGETTSRPIRTVADLQVPDEEFQNFVNEAKSAMLTDEELAETVPDLGINWETLCGVKRQPPHP